MTPHQLSEFLRAAIPLREPVLIGGPPGIGKTEIMHEAAKSLGYDVIVSYPGFEDPTEPGGFLWPAPDHSHAKKILIGAAWEACQTDRPTVWFLDEFGQGQPATQAAYMPWLLARSANGHTLPDHVSFALATNRRTDKAASHSVIEPIKGRVTLVGLETDVDQWCEWAKSNQIDPLVVAFLKHRTDLLCKFEPTGELSNSPMPRNWARASELFQLELSEATKRQAVAGRVGEGAAGEFFAFVTLYQNAVTADQVLKNPKKAKIPKQPHLLYALCVALAYQATIEKWEKGIKVYMFRLHDEGFGEYASLLLQDTLRQCPKIWDAPSFEDVAGSPLGKMIGSV